MFPLIWSDSVIRDEVLGALSLFFRQLHDPEHFCIYFSGHGNKQTGNWVFTDGELSLQDVSTLFLRFAPLKSTLAIVADCCHSGSWVDQVLSFPDDYDCSRFAIQAACLKDEVCWDTAVGGFFTKSWVSGAYHSLAKKHCWEHRGRKTVQTLQTSLNDSWSSWLPWNGLVSKNPGVLFCSFMTATSILNCSTECSSLLSDSDLEHSQHPIATHPHVHMMTFFDHRFTDMPETDRFPAEALCAFIDLQKFWLGRQPN